MKIRNGFVSNSSSSSFLLYFDKLPRDKQELSKILFGDEPPALLYNIYDIAMEYSDEIIENIFNNIMHSDHLSLDDIFKINEWGESIISIYQDSLDSFSKYVSESEMDKYLSLKTEFIKNQEKLNDLYNDEEERKKMWDESIIILNKINQLLHDSFKNKFDDTGVFIDLSYGNSGSDVDYFLEYSQNVFNKVLIQWVNCH
jgi:hypothetical protein